MPLVIAALLAIAVVAGVIAIVDLVHGSNGGGGSSATVAPPVSVSHAPSPTPSGSLSARPTTSAPTTAPATTPASKPPSTPAAVATPAPSATTVQVFNVSSHSGLAQGAADRLRAAGYKVTRVANKKGTSVAATTIYYSPGNATEEAEANGIVARGLAKVAAARPASVAATGTLILYVT